MQVVNSPAHTFSVSNPAALVISNINIDNCKYNTIDLLSIERDTLKAQGDQPNAASGSKAAGHNTDGFDCSTTDLVRLNISIWNTRDTYSSICVYSDNSK